MSGRTPTTGVTTALVADESGGHRLQPRRARTRDRRREPPRRPETTGLGSDGLPRRGSRSVGSRSSTEVLPVVIQWPSGASSCATEWTGRGRRSGRAASARRALKADLANGPAGRAAGPFRGRAGPGADRRRAGRVGHGVLWGGRVPPPAKGGGRPRGTPRRGTRAAPHREAAGSASGGRPTTPYGHARGAPRPAPPGRGEEAMPERRT